MRGKTFKNNAVIILEVCNFYNFNGFNDLGV